MKKYILFACLAFTLTSCKKDRSTQEISTSEKELNKTVPDYENPLQKDLEKSINDSRVKIIKVEEKEVSKEKALQININNVSSTTLVIHKPDSMAFKIELEKLK